MRRNAMNSAGVLISAALLTAVGCNKAAKDTDATCPATCPAGSSATCPAAANRPACRPVCTPQCPIVATTAAPTKLDAETEAALLAAVADERLVQSYYSAVMDKYGQYPPFSRVINAERHHEAMLLDLCTRYGVQVPTKADATDTAVPGSFRASCGRAAELERLNVQMYDKFLGFVDEPDIRSVMTALRDASAERHLPAFQRNS
jgi:hypothetical protein